MTARDETQPREVLCWMCGAPVTKVDGATGSFEQVTGVHRLVVRDGHPTMEPDTAWRTHHCLPEAVAIVQQAGQRAKRARQAVTDAGLDHIPASELARESRTLIGDVTRWRDVYGRARQARTTLMNRMAGTVACPDCEAPAGTRCWHKTRLREGHHEHVKHPHQDRVLLAEMGKPPQLRQIARVDEDLDEIVERMRRAQDWADAAVRANRVARAAESGDMRRCRDLLRKYPELSSDDIDP